jgi:hypothetical protein
MFSGSRDGDGNRRGGRRLARTTTGVRVHCRTVWETRKRGKGERGKKAIIQTSGVCGGQKNLWLRTEMAVISRVPRLPSFFRGDQCIMADKESNTISSHVRLSPTA